MTYDKAYIERLLTRWERAETTETEEAWLCEQLRSIHPLPEEWQPYATLMTALDDGAASLDEAELDAMAKSTKKYKKERRYLRITMYVAAAVLVGILFLLPIRTKDSPSDPTPLPLPRERSEMGTAAGEAPTKYTLTEDSPSDTPPLPLPRKRSRMGTASHSKTIIAPSGAEGGVSLSSTDDLIRQKVSIEAEIDEQLAAIEAQANYINEQNRQALTLVQL